ncbi:DNA cytosine methyltransferase [Sphingopyxis sp. BSN-002]|uniref:DNA cytosine methyltransferase n=1 Tax=Sphingopyxis sp. BSN-002 TaxID=2911495 RepID=UPI001EDA32A5|nr:DNA cytosine methyltransferase [Sphingopyxis sp. BSN-002]UKK83810.1 DNA cytosine methyltransferase [Sphingopyxis sp. BSN-002]
MILQAVDLFAGGGGLTVGLKTAGFKVSSAVECDSHASSTYSINHPEVKLHCDDIRDVMPESILSDAGGKVDLIAGCPPCQGFTSLTSKYRRYDPRNDLIDEMKRLVVACKPMAVMMENVPGLAKKGKSRLSSFIEDLENMGYKVNYDVLQVADYGTPQFRRRLVLFAGLGFEIKMPEAVYDRQGANGKPKWKTVRDVIGGLPAAKAFKRNTIKEGTKVADWHYVRNMSDINLQRLSHAKPGGSWKDIPESLRVPCHQGEYTGFSNVYGRMEWNQTPPTMTGGCTTLSKGRFGHPEQLRTISVKEAALIQEFPESYLISSNHMDKVCNIIGNALPCGFAAAMSAHARSAIIQHLQM